MANANLQTFLEDRLRALEPTIDLDAGSPAQVQFIEPVLTYLGSDPFETDIDSFITDRFRQEFPNVFSDDPGVVRDVFIKPLMVLLAPFKREIQSIKRNQSLRDPTLLSDDDADALVANVFDERDPGGFSVGTGRLFYTNPTNTQIEITNRVFTTDGLSFFPTNPISITAEEMVFNKSGSLYFLDVPLKAEAQGSEYNIDAGQLSGIDGQFGVIKVSNLSKFQNGASVVDTPTFVASAREALNERSLVTRRGATARLSEVFQTELRAVQVIGAKDPEMERDILVATSPGHAWIEGKVALYDQLAMVSASIIDGEETDAPVAGDTLFVYLDKVAYPAIPQMSRFVRLTVDEVLLGPLAASAPYQMLYLVRFSGAFPTGAVIPLGTQLDGGFSKKGTIHISSLPTVGAVDLTVANGSVHIFGHTDFYIRPILQPISTVVFNTLSDAASLVERLTLQTLGLSVEKNKVGDAGAPTIDFVAVGVAPGDLLSIETGDDIGVYVISKVTNSYLYVSTNLTNSQTGIRYRVIKQISINPFEPRVVKFPFGSLLANDLQTTIGSTLFKFATNDILGFGAQVGDTLRVKTGVAVGDYTIQGFDSVLGGKGPIVDRPAPGTSTTVVYEVFSALDPVQRPLVRIKELLLLDSSKQTTGITIPCADPVGAVPTADFTSARVRGASNRLSGFTLPSFATTPLTTYLSGGNVASTPGDRFSLGLDIPAGLYKAVTSPDGSQSELDYHANPATGVGDALDPSSYFVSVSEAEDEAENFPPADPKPGDALFIKNGPNKGNYLIKSVYKFKHKLTGPRTVWTYFIKIYGQFPVDVFGQLFDFLNDAGGGAATVELPITGLVTFPGYFTTFYSTLGLKLNLALTTFGVTSPPSAPTLQAAIDRMVFTEYEWGDPARGTVRTFFDSPTLFQENTGANENPTMFSYQTSSGDIVKFRPDPFRYVQQELVPSRLTTDATPIEYPRDLDQVITLAFTVMTSPFTVGKKLIGFTGGSGTIVNVVSAGPNGTLTLTNVIGTFGLGESIFDDNAVPASASAGATTVTTSLNFTDPNRSSMFAIGVAAGDTLAVHEEVFFHGSFLYGTNESRQTAIQTLAGSTQITAPAISGSIFTADMVGNLLYIEEGADKGGYRVVKYIDGSNLLLDKALTVSTPTILAQAGIGTWGHNGVNNIITSGVFDFTPYIGKYITIFGVLYSNQGSYLISAAPVLGTAHITKSPNFSGSPVLHSEAVAGFVITNGPSSTLVDVLNGTELFGLRPIRMYEARAKEVSIESVVFDDISKSQITVAASPQVRNGLAQPFRIYRSNLRRITPSEMALNAFGPLVYFDTEVVSLSPQASANIKQVSYLTVDEGTFQSTGYRHRVSDRTLTYSMLEDGFLDISPRILPVDSTDSQDNFINLLGSAIQVTYEQADLVRRVQEFADSAQDRVTSANLLARHFLPAYVSYDVSYLGGSAPSVIAADIISYVNSLPVETPLDVSEVQALVTSRGGNPTTPTAVQVLLHDWSRRMWLEFSEDQLGGTGTLVPYDGTPRVSFFVPGPDVSGQDPLPSGEKINLEQL